MEHLLTNKGTCLPLINLKGKVYLQVAHRLVWFREEHPLGLIETNCKESNEKYVIYSAAIYFWIDGRHVKIADAIKREDFSHFSDAHEKASTGAIGRALALCGFGTQFAPEIEEEERIVDGPVERKMEIIKAGFSPSTMRKKVTEAQLKRLYAIQAKSKLSIDDVKKIMKEKFSVESAKDLTMEQYDSIIKVLENETNK